MTNILIIAGALLFLGALLYLEPRNTTLGRILTKTPLSLLFIVLVLIQPHPDQWYFHFVLLALLGSFCGDVFLIFASPKMFMAGLIAFLAAHLFYVLGFASLVPLASWLSPLTLVVFIVSAVVYLVFLPKLGDMKLPVLVYVLVISLMVSWSLAVPGSSTAVTGARWLVPIAAVLFYLSDIFVAREKFWKAEVLNRYLGLPLYYAAQFLLAFSVAWFPRA